jgi:hypothetical protein
MGWNNYEGRGEAAAPRRILFWGDKPGERPQDYVRDDIPKEHRAAIIRTLQQGKEVASFKGWADCRICGVHLGSQDVGNHGFIWPAKAEHYLEAHNVWTPGCVMLLTAIRERAPA